MKIWITIILIVIGAFTVWACTPKAPATNAPTGTQGTQQQPQNQPEQKTQPPATTNTTGDPQSKSADLAAQAKLGWTYFKDPTYAASTNDLSCNSCHPYGGYDLSANPVAKGTLMGKAKTFPKAYPMVGSGTITLIDMINYCIMHPLAGTALDGKDPEMEDMEMFLNALEPKTYDDVLPIIKKSCGGCHTGAQPTAPVALDVQATAEGDAVKLRELIDTGVMPKAGKLDDTDYLTLIIWATTVTDKTKK